MSELYKPLLGVVTAISLLVAVGCAYEHEYAAGTCWALIALAWAQTAKL